MSAAPDWNENQQRLRELIKTSENFREAQALFLTMHASVHFGQEDGATIMDALWTDLGPHDFGVMPKPKDVTIAWNIWHITRIEDLTVNILVNNSEQILNDAWLERLGTPITDTGNAMTDEEIICFSKSINPEALKEYRMATGMNTQKILRQLKPEDMKHKVKPEGLEKIRREGGVLEHPESKWLLEFWGRKDFAGIILMPVTRHQIGHINDCFNLKKVIHIGKAFYMS